MSVTIEQFLGVKPKLDRIVPFGQPGFVWVPEEKRTALDNVRLPCRIVGFGEDNSNEEKKGYHVYIPSQDGFDWSNDVIIDWQSELEPLHNDQAASFAQT